VALAAEVAQDDGLSVMATGTPVSPERLLRDHFEFIWRLLRRMGVPPESCDDAAQEVFIIALRKVSAITARSERSFLYGVAIRVASDWRRAASRRPDTVSGVPVGESQSAAPLPDEVVAQKEARAMLDAVLSELDPDLRAVFVLYELEGMTAAEVAACIGLAPGTVASRLSRARREFQKHAARRAERGVK
jgi:RNA polymerase sigma-70 factor (ECF subfamily)